ncbi:MAG: MBL fold metallo-hydrolase, partial [Chromatiales bacterium]|nr:MBL fold metallo-hydrolase [Chromatiales bacterium]
MQLQILGAAGEVTGSCYLIESGGRRVLLECGLKQGSRSDEQANRADFPFDPKSIDAVVLSHAHIDHSGRLPLL